MGYTQWILVQSPELTFHFVSEKRYGHFHAGRAPLPQARPGEVRTAEVMLYLDGRFATELLALNHRRFPVLAHGVRDPASMSLEMILIAEVISAGLWIGRDSATQRFIRRQMDGAFRWTPTAREAQAIADVVNRRARWPLLGGNSVRLV